MGAQWRLEGAAVVPRLQSLWVSGDCEAYWYFHLVQEQERHRPSLYSVL